VDDSAELEGSDEPMYAQENTVLLVLLDIAPRFVVDGMQNVLASISAEFDADGFMAAVFVMSAIVASPVIDDASAGQALQLVASVSEILPHVPIV
jgi:hypothetical protein